MNGSLPAGWNVSRLNKSQWPPGGKLSFGFKPAPAAAQKTAAITFIAPKDHINLLDPKRANQVSILLKSLKLPELGGPLRAALLRMDEEKLSPSMCASLLAVAPTAAEIAAFRRDGALGLRGNLRVQPRRGTLAWR